MPDYLMHYGVKGMKKGVRKKIDTAERKALWKANKKMLKVNKDYVVAELNGANHSKAMKKSLATANKAVLTADKMYAAKKVNAALEKIKAKKKKDKIHKSWSSDAPTSVTYDKKTRLKKEWR